MRQVSFVDVARLVNKVPGTKIDIDSPAYVDQERYAIYNGVVSGSGFDFKFKIAYVYSGATKDSVVQLVNRIRDDFLGGKGKIVYTQSVTKSLIEYLQEKGFNCVSLSDYYVSFFKEQAVSYIDKIKSLSFENYTEPQIITPRFITRKHPNPVLEFMKERNILGESGNIAVLLGEPGQGKTHMSKYLAVSLANMNKIPIYVHSEQWTKMQVEDLSSISKAIVSSFRYFEAPIGWVEGNEDEFLSVSLGLGVFSLIFDGFDEFILWNRGAVDSREGLQKLLDLSGETGAKLCITSRTNFWDSEFGEDGQDLSLDSHVLRYEIAPFDVNQARNYFGKRFGDNQEFIEKSVRLFQSLKEGRSTGFVGRGFFLTLIADLVSRGFVPGGGVGGGESQLQWIMKVLCDREKIRQKLPIGSRVQLDVLKEFAEMVNNGELPSTETLRLTLEVIAGLDEGEISQLVKVPAKLKDHPLITYDKRSDVWTFTQEQTRYSLLADRVLELCEKVDSYPRLRSLLRSDIFVKELQSEVAISIVQQIFETNGHEDALHKCKHVIAAISSVDNGARQGDESHHAFAGSLALFAADKVYAKGAERGDRTKVLLSLLPSAQLKGMRFSGTISGFDFRGLEVSDCFFDKVVFTNCRFSDETQIINCKFIELKIVNCQDFGLVQWGGSNCADEQTNRLVDAVMISGRRRAYGMHSLQDDIDCLVRRFLPRETGGFKNVEERNISKGLISHSLHKNLIIDLFKKSFLESHVSSGVTIYSVSDSAKNDFSFFVTNNAFIGLLADFRDELCKKIELH